MRRLLLIALLVPGGTAQDGWMPFRRPEARLESPAPALFDLLRGMRRIAESPEAAVTFDRGVEIVDHPEWRRLRNELKGQVTNKGGLLGNVVWESANVDDRATALYGIYYLDDVAKTIELIPLIPGEPVPELRVRNYPRAVEFLKVHWERSAKVNLNAEPFFGLLETGDVRDQAQGLWFLLRLLELRPETGVEFLNAAQVALRHLLVSTHADVRLQARLFLEAVAPKIPAPKTDDDEARRKWLETALYELLPPLRPRGTGALDLYPSADRDQVVAVGREALRAESIFVRSSGRTSAGTNYRGLRVARLPEPLDKLRIPLDAVLISINGSPIEDGPGMLTLIEGLVKANKPVLVEFVHGGATRMMEYRVAR